MKKTYIIPSSKIYAINAKDGILNSISMSENPGNSGTPVDTKEEKASGAGMWDLYN